VEIEKLKLKVKDSVESQRQQLIQLSLNIHDNPELGFKDEKASTWLTGYLEDNGFHIDRGIVGLATAFLAIYSQKGPRIALLAKYDALPDIGYGCGHNITRIIDKIKQEFHRGQRDIPNPMAKGRWYN
jgi:metal-dependent amidase/aminoacylase/carboxypeptidase family protein